MTNPQVVKRQAETMISIRTAQKNASIARASSANLFEQIHAQQQLCQALEAAILESERDGAQPDPVYINMAVNEFAVLGDFLVARGDRAGAEEAYNRGMDIASKYGDPGSFLRAQIDRASAMAQEGRYAPALASLFRARQSAFALPPAAGIDAGVKAGHALAQVLRWLGDTDRAADLIADTRERLARLPDGPAQLLLNTFKTIDLDQEAAVLSLDRARLRRSEDRVTAAEQAAGEIGKVVERLRICNRLGYIALRVQLAQAALLKNDYASALNIVDQSLPEFQEGTQLFQKLGTLRVLRASILNECGRGRDALADADAGVRGEETFEQRETIWKAYWQQARARKAGAPDRPEWAAEAFDNAVRSLNQIRTATLGYRLDNLALQTTRPMVHEAAMHACQMGDAVRTAWYSDAIKARFLGVALAKGKPAQVNPKDLDEIDATGKVIDPALGRESAFTERVETAVADRLLLLEQLHLAAGVDTAASDAELDVKGVLAALLPNQAAIQLLLSGSILVAVLFKNGTTHVDFRNLSAEVLNDVHSYARNVRQPRSNAFDRDPQRWNLDFDSLLPASIIDKLWPVESLLICPNGPLNLLPWSALMCGGQRLFERTRIGVLPNLISLSLLARRPAALPRVAIFGNPDGFTGALQLKGTAEELAEIAQLYRQSGTLIQEPQTGANATLAGLRDVLANDAATGGILHLSCHGVVDSRDPVGFGLALSDRFMMAAELALRPMRFAEVVLSACSTGVRPERLGDVDILGDDGNDLASGFLEAGAQCVLVSTSPVSGPAGAAFTTAYHRNRLKGRMPLAAFASAQNELYSGGVHPLYQWCGFTLISCR